VEAETAQGALDCNDVLSAVRELCVELLGGEELAIAGAAWIGLIAQQ
jgi:hypothetical protein